MLSWPDLQTHVAVPLKLNRPPSEHGIIPGYRRVSTSTPTVAVSLPSHTFRCVVYKILIFPLPLCLKQKLSRDEPICAFVTLSTTGRSPLSDCQQPLSSASEVGIFIFSPGTSSRFGLISS